MPITKAEGRKDGKQKYRVRVNYIDAEGRYKQAERTAYGVGEAKLIEAQLMDELSPNTSSGSKTVEELCNEYIAYKKSALRASSLDRLKSKLQSKVIDVIGSVKLNKLTTAVLTKWRSEIDNLDIKTVTKRNAFVSLKTLLGYAVKMGYIPESNMNRIDNFRDPDFETAQDKIHYYTPEQFLTYKNVADENTKNIKDRGFYVFFCIAYYTGMRKGEINALKWTDIEGDIIHVRRSVCQNINSQTFETPPKTKNSYRDIQIPEPLMEILEQHKADQRKEPRFTEDFRVCGGIDILRNTTIDIKNRKFAQAAGLPRIRVHDFRHSHVSLLANEGINIQEIARRLGHSNIETTWNTYSHLYPRENERAIKILNKIR